MPDGFLKQLFLRQIAKLQELVVIQSQALINQLNEVYRVQYPIICPARCFDTLNKLCLDLLDTHYILDIMLFELGRELDRGYMAQSNTAFQVIRVNGTPIVCEQWYSAQEVDQLLQAYSICVATKDPAARLKWMNSSFGELANRPRVTLLHRTSGEIWNDQYGRNIVSHDLAVSNTRQAILFEEFVQIGPVLRRQLAVRFPVRFNGSQVYRTGVVAVGIED